MKISPYEKRIIRNNVLGSVAIGLGFVGAVYYFNKEYTEHKQKVEEAKTYIRKNNILKYVELNYQDKYDKALNWPKEAEKLQTQLKMDSIAKTNYALGMQAVRDSLAKADKNKSKLK